MGMLRPFFFYFRNMSGSMEIIEVEMLDFGYFYDRNNKKRHKYQSINLKKKDNHCFPPSVESSSLPRIVALLTFTASS